MYYEAKDFVDTESEEKLRWIVRARELTRAYACCDWQDNQRKEEILRELLGRMGDQVAVDNPFHCNYGKNIFVGDQVVINMNCTFVDDAPILIGNRVLIASNVQIYTASHPTAVRERLLREHDAGGGPFFRTYARPVEIQDDAWIGGGCILLPGVTVGAGSVIGAGSVVTRSIPENCVAVGNPCRVIRRLKEDPS